MSARPASKTSGSRRDRSEAQAALTSERSSVQSSSPDVEPSGWNPGALKSYLQQVRLEMKRVTWPTRRELQAATVVVLLTLTIFAGYLGVLDFVLRRIFH